jgi:inner membrane protein
MTGRTHDLAAFSALSLIVATQNIPQMSLATVIVAVSANLIGGLTPDIDQPTAELWHKIPAGTVIGKILYPLLGGHRFISHSVVGVILFGFGAHFLLDVIHSVLLVDMGVVWWSFMIGYVSHLVLDTFTRDGVPWLFPIPMKMGIPPLKHLRIKTGGSIEKSIVFPLLMVFTAYVYYANYARFVDFFKYYIHK